MPKTRRQGLQQAASGGPDGHAWKEGGEQELSRTRTSDQREIGNLGFELCSDIILHPLLHETSLFGMHSPEKLPAGQPGYIDGGAYAEDLLSRMVREQSSQVRTPPTGQLWVWEARCLSVERGQGGLEKARAPWHWWVAAWDRY